MDGYASADTAMVAGGGIARAKVLPRVLFRAGSSCVRGQAEENVDAEEVCFASLILPIKACGLQRWPAIRHGPKWSWV